MARIKIKDLPAGMTVSQDELRRIKGGLLTTSMLAFPKVETSFIKIETDPGDLLANTTGTYIKW